MPDEFRSHAINDGRGSRSEFTLSYRALWGASLCVAVAHRLKQKSHARHIMAISIYCIHADMLIYEYETDFSRRIKWSCDQIGNRRTTPPAE
jgi:hypothetical protein